MERTGRASYRRGESSDRASIEEELKRELIRGWRTRSLGVISGQRKKKARLTGGPRLSVRGEENRRYRFGWGGDGPASGMLAWALARARPRWLLSFFFDLFLFFFLFSVFLILS
jgi:hypothetical protein